MLTLYIDRKTYPHGSADPLPYGDDRKRFLIKVNTSLDFPMIHFIFEIVKKANN